MTSTTAGTTPAPTTSSSPGCAACRRAPRRHRSRRHRTRARLPRLRHGRRADLERRGTMDSAGPTGPRLCGGRARLAGWLLDRRRAGTGSAGPARLGRAERRELVGPWAEWMLEHSGDEVRAPAGVGSTVHPALQPTSAPTPWATDGAEVFRRTPLAPPATPVTAPWTERPCVPVPGPPRPRAPGSQRRRAGAATEPAPRHHMPLAVG
jgi:hypothetical protein